MPRRNAQSPPSSKLSPEILAALEQVKRRTEARSFADGFRAGEQFMYDRIERILCSMCSQNIPKLDLAGTMVHEVDVEGKVWRRTCEARLIHPFKS